MERLKKERRHRKKAPRIPIETYRWEDIRRARLRGGYPWTHLYKDPFSEQVDPSVYKMDKKTKTKKGLAPKKPLHQLEIKEISNGTEGHDSLTPEPSGYIIITEVPSDSENHSKDVASSSVTIEDVGETEGVNIESAESSDNISQYLDKEEPTIEPAEVPPTKKEEQVKTDNGRQERAKSEETKRKRKLSLESSYSRKSLSKLAIMKKLRDAKEKIKVPKLNLPSLPNLSLKPLKPDTTKSKPKDKKQPEKTDKKQNEPTNFDPNAKPVYVHIPLKPPEGQTDEFSYLEFGEKKPEEAPKPPEPEEPPKPPPLPPTIEISEVFDESRRFSGDPDDIVAFEILKAETVDLDHPAANGLQGKNEFLIIEQEEDAKSETRSMIIFMPGPDEPSLSRAGSRKASPRATPSRQGSKKSRAKSAEPENRQVRAKSAEPERKRKLSVESGTSRRSLPKIGFLQKLKDAKDKLFTLSRGDSKKAPRKKGKDEESGVKEQPKVEVKKSEPSSNQPKYIHIPLKPPPGKFDEFSHLEFDSKQEAPTPIKAESIKKEQSSIDSPASPKAEGLQFIFLTPPSDDEVLKEPEIPETPSSESSKNFFSSRVHELKEIAQDAVDRTSPKSTKKLQSVTEEEAPSKTESEDTKQAESEAEKLKKKQVKGKKTKSEDEKNKKPEEKEKPETGEANAEKMVVDEEDGLKLTESAMAKQEQNIKAKEIEQTEKGWKKKVSFKRRSKDDSKDGDYEDIQVPTDEKPAEKSKTTDEQKSKVAVMGNSQSMSVEEEKSYLDEQKIIKSTSLEEDYNRWSKLSDHEYEPVNPPPDNVTPVSAAPPTVHVIDTDRGQQKKPTSLASSTTSLERRMLGAEGETSPEEPFTVQEMQTEIENKYFTKAEEIPSKTQTTVHTVTTGSSSETQKGQPKKSEGPSKFQQAIKTQTDKLKVQTDKFKTKLHEMKKPNIKLPSAPTMKKPNLQKFKFEKPKINLPKMPDAPKISLPTFSLPRKSPLKRSLKQRQLSTESNAGGSKKNYFDFRTYPRLFKKKPKDDIESFSSKNEKEVPEFATVPRTKRNKGEEDRWGGRDSIRVPLHPQESIESQEREDSVERRMASHMRYDQDIDIDDAYEKENQEIHTASRFSHNFNSRWNHGSFHPSTQEDIENARNRQVTDLDSPEDGPAAPHESFDTNTSRDIHSSESSLGMHRRGVLEEIDSDEFFLRQKGISQDNIEVGAYLSSEIREAFKYPTNALADLQREPVDYSYDARASNQSLPETPSKRKIVKKPKRKKTPHVSHEQISFDQDSELDNELPPSRPKRRSRRSKKKEDTNVIPYQETIAVDVPEISINLSPSAEDNERLMYENGRMQGKEHPEITLSEPYDEREVKYDSEDEVFKEDATPAAPPRKHRSLKSLSYSEHDSILGDVDPDREPLEDVEVYKTEHEYIIPTPDIPPVKPARTLSQSSSKSREEFKEVEETPIKPTRTRSHADSLALEEQEPCIEEPCVEDFRDCMGYAVIDKHTRRAEGPLPPPRTPPRRKRSLQSGEQKFFTVPRPLNDEAPMRPIRNYSTLGPSRPPRRKQPINMTDEEKENIDITQYIEIDEEPNRDLQSGDVIQKMRDRPLPAPPRPPRKTRTHLHYTSSEENILGLTQGIIDEERGEFLEEAEVSTQTEPLPDDFLCEYQVHEEGDATEEPPVAEETEPVTIERRLITPTSYTYEEETVTHGSLIVEPLNGAKILPDSQLTRVRRSTERIIPVTKDYDDEETSEIPEEFMKLKDPEPVQAIPDSAQAPPLQPSIIERIIERPVLVQPDPSTEVEVLKAQRLQVSDLDVDRLSVNELLASRIVVAEIDSGSIQASEISSKSGALRIGEIELPPSLVQQLLERLQSVAQEQQSSGATDPKPAAGPSTKEESEDAGQKKTPFEPVTVETLPPPQRPPRKTEDSHETSAPPIDALIEEPHIVDVECIQSDSLNISETEESQEVPETVDPPEPPVRTDSSKKTPQPLEPVLDEQIEESHEQVPQRPPRQKEDISTKEPTPVEAREPVEEPPVDVTAEQQRMQEPEIDDEPPPRPPQPHFDYIPSQPPPSFYALRAQQYVEGVEGDIPAAPRRRRPQKPRISRSSSDESPAPPPSRRRYRSPEPPTIPQLTGQLMQACGSAANSSIKRLIAHITNNVLRNGDGRQDLHVIVVVLLVLVAALILLGFGDGKTVHYHHWEFFNPPRDM